MEGSWRGALLALVAGLVGVAATGHEQPFCTDLKPQNSLDMSQIMGMWYGVEIIPHLREEDGMIDYDTCPVIHLSEVRETDDRSNGQENLIHDRQRYRNRQRYRSSHMTTTPDSHLRPGDYGYNWNYGSYGVPGHHNRERDYRQLRLYWDESGNNIEYMLKFNNTRRGFWISSGPQNGSLLSSQYDQFAGTVQVMKAVSDHLVLTLCQRLPESQLFTVILSREPHQLSKQVVTSIHNLLNRRDLSTASVRKVCRNSAIPVEFSLASMAAFSLVSLIAYFGSGMV